MASIKVVLKNKSNSKGECPIVLSIIKDRKVKRISLGLNCLPKDWDSNSLQFKKSYPNYIQRNRLLTKILEKAYSIVDSFRIEEINFTLNQFEETFRGKSKSDLNVSEFWLDKISDLIKSGRIGNANAYDGVYKSFFKFVGVKNIVFREITPTLLGKYEVHLRSINNTDGGVAFKMRHLRAVFNDAIEKGVTEEKYYPFKSYKISRLKGKNVKKALSREDIRLMETIDVEKHPYLLNARNYLIFSYYIGGMNFVDMMKLQWSDVNGDRINYTRSKTKKNFSVLILEPVKKVLEFYKAQNRSTNYVFPILLRSDLTPVQIDNRKKKVLKKFNKDLKEIAKIQDINTPVSSYSIRHSFATNLKFAGVSTDIISDAMGHANVEITKAYLKTYSDEVIDSEMKKLLKEPQPNYNNVA